MEQNIIDKIRVVQMMLSNLFSSNVINMIICSEQTMDNKVIDIRRYLSWLTREGLLRNQGYQSNE
jgi:hypothetical protein